MKKSKKIVLKTHPDKSKLEPKYFLFFTKAYKRLYAVYEFQNKNINKVEDHVTYESKEHNQLLTQFFEKDKSLKDSTNFNKWFNDQFEKHRLEDPVEHGYGNWLKSDEDIVFTPQNVNKDTMAKHMEKRKKEIQALTPYKGVGDAFLPSTAGGSAPWRSSCPRPLPDR